MENDNFIYDKEKLLDLLYLSKAEFLKSYSYLNEQEYDITVNLVIAFLKQKKMAGITVFDDTKTWDIVKMATFISEINHTTDYEPGDYDPAIMVWLSSEKESGV